MNLLFLFIVLNIANVIIQTIKSIATIKCGKTMAAIINAVAYGLYTIVIIYTNANINLWLKVLVVAGANLFGVYIVKFIEEKKQKDKIWKIEITVPKEEQSNFLYDCEYYKFSYNQYPIDNKYCGFNIYSYSQKESLNIKKILKDYNAKYFVSETKIL